MPPERWAQRADKSSRQVARCSQQTERSVAHADKLRSARIRLSPTKWHALVYLCDGSSQRTVR
jgi:hypothetical protein